MMCSTVVVRLPSLDDRIVFDATSHQSVLHSLITARAVLETALRQGEDLVLDNYMVFIVFILRVRQSSCHASLVPPDCREQAKAILEQVQRKSKEDMDMTEAEDLLERLRRAFGGMEAEKIDECAVCFENLVEESAVVLRTCKHVSFFSQSVANFVDFIFLTRCCYHDRSFVRLAWNRSPTRVVQCVVRATLPTT